MCTSLCNSPYGKVATGRIRVVFLILAIAFFALLSNTPEASGQEPVFLFIACLAVTLCFYAQYILCQRCCLGSDRTKGDARWAVVEAGGSAAALRAALEDVTEPPAPALTSRRGATLLHQAVLTAPHLIGELLAAGVPVGAREGGGATALALASSQEAIEALAAHAPAEFSREGPAVLRERLGAGRAAVAALLHRAGLPFDSLSLSAAIPHLSCMRLALAGGCVPTLAHLSEALEAKDALSLLLGTGSVKPSPALLAAAVRRCLLPSAALLLPSVGAAAAAEPCLVAAAAAVLEANTVAPLEWTLAHAGVTPSAARPYLAHFATKALEASADLDDAVQAARDAQAEAATASAQAAATAARMSALEMRDANRCLDQADDLLRQERAQRAQAAAAHASARAARAPVDASPSTQATVQLLASQHQSLAALCEAAADRLAEDAAPLLARGQALRAAAEAQVEEAQQARRAAEARRGEAGKGVDRARQQLQACDAAVLALERHTGKSAPRGQLALQAYAAAEPAAAVTISTTTTTTTMAAGMGGSSARKRAGSRAR